MSAAITAAAIAVGGSAIIANDQAQRAKGEANKARSAAKQAAQAGIEVEEKQLEEQKYQFDQQMAEYNRKQALLEQQFAQSQRLLAPYITSGQGALYEMNALMGLAAPQQVTYTMEKGPGGQYEAVQQPSVQRTSPAFGVGGAAPTAATEAGKLSMLGGRIAEPSFASTGGREITSPASQQAADVLAEFGKGGRSLTSKIWETASDKSTRKQAAMILQDTMAQNPNMSFADQYNLAKQKAMEIGAMTPQQAGQAAAASSPIAQQQIETQVNPYAGMTGQEAQASAIEKISSSPLLAELTRQGEEAMLQQAAATGGLRGGNIQGALAQYRPQMLQNEIDKYYSRLSQMSGVGQQSILSSPTVSQASGYPTTYPTSSNLGSLYSSLAGTSAIQPSTSSQGGTTQALIGGISQLAGAGLGYLANQPQTTTTTTTAQQPTIWSGTA